MSKYSVDPCTESLKQPHILVSASLHPHLHQIYNIRSLYQNVKQNFRRQKCGKWWLLVIRNGMRKRDFAKLLSRQKEILLITEWANLLEIYWKLQSSRQLETMTMTLCSFSPF